MDTIVFPDAVVSKFTTYRADHDVFFFNYHTNQESEKNKVIFRKHMVNFILNGHKTLQTLDGTSHIDDSQSLIIRSGYCLTTEKFARNDHFSSLTVYFDASFVHDFLTKHSRYLSVVPNQPGSNVKDVYVFTKDDFIHSFLTSVKHLMEEYEVVPVELSRLKLEEIFLYLVKKDGAKFLSYMHQLTSHREEVDFRLKMEVESLHKLTLEEMAFLCNMSLSTFKRKFSDVFGMPPQKWFINKRLQYAYELLQKNDKTPSELYLELGYNNLSSFSTAFSKQFGISPNKVQPLKNELL